MLQKGSYITSENGDIIYNIGENIDIIAGKDTYDYAFDTETKNAGIVIGSTNPASMAIDEISGSLGYSTADQKTASITYANSAITAENGSITINVKKNATISGADILAQNIALNIGEDLTVESKQNESHGKGGSNGLNLGYGSNGADFGVSHSQNKYDRIWTDRQTGIIGTQSVDIDTKGETRLAGSITANINNGIDAGNLALKTGKLTYRNLTDYESAYNNGFNFQISGLGIGEKTKNGEKNKYIKGTLTLGMQNTGYEKKGISDTVIGKGSIYIGDNADMTNLNRDINRAQTITEDIITGALDFETGIDLRLSSKSGRDEIKEDFRDAGREIAVGYKTIEGNLFNERATRDLISKLKETDKNYYWLTAEETKILGKMEQLVQKAGYDVKSMSRKDKLAVFDNLSKKERAC